MANEVLKFSDIDQPNLEWRFSEYYVFNLYVKKTAYNRFKWWISTKLFLPGTYKWLK